MIDYYYILLNILLPIVIAFVASSGFWIFLEKKFDRKSFQTELLIGLAHDRITYLGLKYIQRGSITKDEYENLERYLYRPYKNLGGNGSVDRIMKAVDGLIITETPLIKKRRTKKDVIE